MYTSLSVINYNVTAVSALTSVVCHAYTLTYMKVGPIKNDLITGAVLI